MLLLIIATVSSIDSALYSGSFGPYVFCDFVAIYPAVVYFTSSLHRPV